MELPDIKDILISKLRNEVLSEKEERLFAEWYADPENQEIYASYLRIQASAIAGKALSVDRQAAWKKVRPSRRSSKQQLFIRYAAAAVIFVAVALGAYFFNVADEEAMAMSDVKPATFMAVLSTNGVDTYLSQTDTMAITEEGIVIHNALSEFVHVDSELSENREDNKVNTLTVPRGGYFMTELSDGTTVWLNSETVLNFPTRFSGDVRVVDVVGEAFFKVASDTSKPFIVRTGDYDVRVTGTEFNVKNYKNTSTATTLIEGRVQVEYEGETTKLLPGQQAILKGDHLEVEQVNVKSYTAWMEGEFSFRLERLESIMAELSRWYDIEVVWEEQALKDMRFSAWFSRESGISEIAEIMGKTEKVSLRMEAGKIRVTRK